MQQWLDPTYIEAYLRNWLIELGRETGLPLLGKDWELAAVAIVALIALWIWLWPTRRAFRNRGVLRWLVLALNVAAAWFLPLWLFALVLSSIRRSSTPVPTPKPIVPRQAAPPGNTGLPAVLADVVKTVAAIAAKKQAATEVLGPWGKHKPAAAPKPNPAASPSANPSARPAAKPMPRPQVTLVRAARSSSLPNRQSWVRRRG